MKKLMMIACMMLFSTAMFAEKGDLFVGGGISYGMGSDYTFLGWLSLFAARPRSRMYLYCN